MNLSTLLRREWGAATFVLTVLLGMIVVPLALYFGNVKPAPVSIASAARTAAPVTSVSPSPTK